MIKNLIFTAILIVTSLFAIYFSYKFYSINRVKVIIGQTTFNIPRDGNIYSINTVGNEKGIERIILKHTENIK